MTTKSDSTSLVFIRAQALNTMIGLGEEEVEEEEDFDGRVPPDFHSKKWPSPKLINNRPQGKDKALVWFMNEKEDEIAQHIDVNSIPKKFRFASKLYVILVPSLQIWLSQFYTNYAGLSG